MKIQFFSDVHLEFGDLPLIHTDADIIVAAGDIGIHTQGLHWLQQANKPVVYVAGNHEFYQGEYHTTLLALRRQAASGVVQFLEQDCFIYRDVRFLGCTLWTALDGDVDILRSRVNDFRYIRCGQNSLLLNDYMRWHHDALAWLQVELDKPYHGQTVVITHHAPLLSSWKDSPLLPMRAAYCNDLSVLLRRHDIAIWFHGHTHYANDYVYAATRVLCNPRGYYGFIEVPTFDLSKFVEI